MAAQSYDFTGKTVDEAIAEGLKTLKLRQDQVDVEVLNKGSRGIFGIGSEPAHVRLTVRAVEPSIKPVTSVGAPPQTPAVTSAPVGEEAVAPAAPTQLAEPASESSPTNSVQQPAPASPPIAELTPTTAPVDEASDEELLPLAVELLDKMIQLMGFQGEVVASWQAGDSQTSEYGERYLLLDVHGNELGALIGRRGETLDNLQYLLRLMINQRLRQWKNIVVDVEQYKARRVNQLTQLALRMADQVTTSGREISLEPMPANERRVVHLALRDHPSVYTASSGDGERRKVHIAPKR